jgi:hypothetical protein
MKRIEVNTGEREVNNGSISMSFTIQSQDEPSRNTWDIVALQACYVSMLKPECGRSRSVSEYYRWSHVFVTL